MQFWLNKFVSLILKKFKNNSFFTSLCQLQNVNIHFMPSTKTAATSVRKNWAGNYQYQAKNLYKPTSVAEVQLLVKKSGKIKALGSRHCFNNIADSPFNQISTEHLDKMLGIDEVARTVTVEGGAKYGQFAPALHQRGYALHNLASLPHISVAGACATATHGSGVKNGNLATSVTAMEFVDGKGDLVILSRTNNPETFNGAIVSLGAIGIITKLTLAIEPAYEVRQDVFQNLPLLSLMEHFTEIVSAGYSVSLFTNWLNKNISQVWIKRRVESGTTSLGNDFYGAAAATQNLHPITRLSAVNCTEQLGVPGAWYQRLPHFKMGFTPSSGEELQSEFFVPLDNAVDAILAITKKGELIFPQLMAAEIRTVAADDYWLSPCYKQACVALHFTWKQNTPEVMKLLTVIEAELAPFNYRPHWGKVFTMAPSRLKLCYNKLPEFINLLKLYDPENKFGNAYLDFNILGF